MKTKILSIILAGGLFVSSGCSDFLDQIPDNVLTVEDIFKSKDYVDDYLTQIYANIPNELSQRLGEQFSGPWTAGSDEAKYNWDFNYANNLNRSTWATTDGTVSNLWNNFYKSIRNATDFIDKIDGANEAEVNTAMKSRYKAEARALRAMYYYWLVRIYGPVPMVNKVLPVDAPLSEVLLPRSSFDECISFIVGELDQAYNDLPIIPVDDEYGRITKGIVKAFKVEALMLNASPLFNGNADMAGLVNKDGKQLINQSYDANKWKAAADAAKEFLDLFVPVTYDLYVDPSTTSDPFIKAYLSTRNVMSAEWNKEWIFARPKSMNRSEYDKTPKHVGYTTAVQGAGALGATQKMVDAYFMANGLSIGNQSSGYQSTGSSDFKAPFDVKARSTYNQWINREPRFYVGITYNRSYWLFQGSNTSEVVSVMELSGNSGRKQSTSDVSPTGYIVRKNVVGNSNDRGNVQLRLAQIYLDYAEALNEYDPGNSNILKYLNLIRERAGIPTYGSGQGQISVPATQSLMREAIRKERQVELAFENVRYFDARRWKIASTEFAGEVYGMNMFGDGNAFYGKTLIETRTFRQRDYLWPIPNDEILKNELMVQNPGW
ncbi:putative outer membrane starch-binding protein [Arcticibacter tournemirensis]|uniref:RagB/SusD family nutrient uptake outer membrane protein n=1 Tax=Arcticibacter tournemirensis TaxID=699437 RepID=A0A5M9GRM4_9SPHI|nr:RagB/SusD family nutrient uptake outer membrane protein [Arcticibacter tournemirensis]KAA8477196.1 RagB/SusD family nutrient uptake outer membrane protein [Arcticibacter tournemirensis]TQM50193.1 putative outer membrane starch-binding protein [Arcticibacter tournemirensis]